jgi:protein-S-isoprenylcysteine O-methyltransferase Ste14
MNGPYRWSRNPIYVALTLIYAGIALVIGSPWLLLLMPAIVAILHFGVVAREERYLEAKFGQSYLGYKASVRRWL